MGNTSFFNRAIKSLSDKTGVSEVDICSKKPTTEATWCRYILAKQLASRDMTPHVSSGKYFNPSQIARMIGVTPSSVANYLKGYDDLFVANKAFQELAIAVHYELQ